MTPKDYKAGVLSTESIPTTLEMNQLQLHAILTLAQAATALADQAKRRLFYGKPVDQTKLGIAINAAGNMANYLAAAQEYSPTEINSAFTKEQLAQIEQLPPELANLDLANFDVRRLHASLGVFTEGGEMVEHMLSDFEGKPRDDVGFIEELGDVDWYVTIGTDAANITEEVRRRINNQKLTDKRGGRYKKGAFTVADAIDRDAQVERALLDAANDGAREALNEKAAV